MDKEETTSSETVVTVDLKKIDLSKEPHIDQSQSPSSSQKSTSDCIEENILEEHKLEKSLERTNGYIQRLRKQLADIKMTIERQENLKQKLQRQPASNLKRKKVSLCLIKR